MQDLMEKARSIFLEHFARLGLFARVAALAGPMAQEEEGAKAKEEKVTHPPPSLLPSSNLKISRCLKIRGQKLITISSLPPSFKNSKMA